MRLLPVLGIDLPIIQAPIGSAASPALAAAVANAGGLGTLSISWSTEARIRRMIRATRALTQRPFAVNLVLEWPQEERLKVALDEGVRIISTFCGNPSASIQAVHEAGGLLMHTIGSLDDAAAAVAAGVDIIVIQGVEAGGHVCTDIPLMRLIRQIRAAFPDAPLVAAGGLADAADVTAVLDAGADAAWLGTRFVCSAEANAADLYQQKIIEAHADDTVMTTVFSLGWPDSPHRVIRNSTVRMAAGAPADRGAGSTPDIVAHSRRGTPIERYAFGIPTRGMTGDLEAMALYAGCSVEKIHDVRPAADLVRSLSGVG